MSNPVLDLLKKQDIAFTVSGKDYVTHCLNPDHNDKNPSFRIDKVTGIAHCFSCGFKTNIFKYFGVLNSFTSIKIAKLKQKLQDLNVNLNGVSFPEDKTPITKSFRGISIQTLKDFEAFYSNTKQEYADRIWFPIKDLRNRTLVFVGRHMMSDGEPRYLNFPTGVSMPIYPEVFKERHTSAVLVEGIFDMLNLYDKGIRNVFCSFGTNTLFKDTELKLLGLKAQGITKIYLMYDGDKPGQDAMAKLEPLLQECGYNTEILFIDEDSDPGDLSQEYVNSLKEYMNEKDSSSR